MGRHAAGAPPAPDTPEPTPRKRRTYEDDAYAKACGRMLAALERRASTNPDALAYMLTIKSELDRGITRAGHALSTSGGGQFSLGEIAGFLTYNGHAMSRQAAQQRWGAKSIARKLGLPAVTEHINNVVRLADWRARRAAPAPATPDSARDSRAV